MAGGGSCRYCDVVKTCRKTVRKAKKYTSNREVLDILRNSKKLCPPPKGTWSISYSKVPRQRPNFSEDHSKLMR